MRPIIYPPQMQGFTNEAGQLGKALGSMFSRKKDAKMTPYQEKSIGMKEQELEMVRQEKERRDALIKIAGIDSQAKLMESKGEDYKAYLQQNKPLYERWASYRIQDGVVVSNIDVADAISIRLQRETTDADNSIKLLESQVLKASLDKSNDKGELEAELRDAWAIKKQLMASGPQIMNTKLALVEADNKAINAGRDADPIKTPERTEAWNAQLETNKKLTESIIKTGGARDYSLPTDDDSTDTDIAKGLGTDKVTPPPNSDSEVSDPNTKTSKYGDDAVARTGESLRKGVLGGFDTATDALGKSLQFIKDIPNRQTRLTAGILGQDVPEYAQKGQPDQLTQALAEVISQFSGSKPLQKLDAPPTGIIDRIGNAIRSKEAPLWQEKYTNPMSEMLYKLLYKKNAGLPGAR